MIFPTLVSIWSSPKETDQKSASSVLTFFCNTYFHPERTKTIYRFTVRLEKINKLFFASQWIGQPSSHCAILFCIWESLNQCSEACLSNPLNFLHQYQTYYLRVISLKPWKSSITQREFEKVPAGMTRPPFSTKIILLKRPESFCTSASLCSPQDQKDLCHATQ